MSALLFDTHAHLDYFDPTEVSDVLSRAGAAGVGRILTIGTDMRSSRRAIELASAPDVYAAVGIHPHDADGLDAGSWRELETLARQRPVVAIGETGLDYFRMLSAREAQVEAFERHLELAAQVGLPVIIHCRDAYEDLKVILRAKKPERAILHCFSSGPDDVQTFLDIGCYISFSGTVTFSNAANLREAAALVPLDRLLIETDCPYLTPHPHRGERNEPAYVKLVAEKIAEVKKAPLSEIVNETTANADNLFCG